MFRRIYLDQECMICGAIMCGIKKGPMPSERLVCYDCVMAQDDDPEMFDDSTYGS